MVGHLSSTEGPHECSIRLWLGTPGAVAIFVFQRVTTRIDKICARFGLASGGSRFGKLTRKMEKAGW